MFTGYKEWQIKERVFIRFRIESWMVGFNFDTWTWIHIPMIEICINFSKGPMFGYGEGDEMSKRFELQMLRDDLKRLEKQKALYVLKTAEMDEEIERVKREIRRLEGELSDNFT